MKIRNGFVSNSSSSSFIIKKDKKFPDTYSVAKSMVKDHLKEYKIYSGHGEHPSHYFINENLEYLKDNNLNNVPIMFYSTNYDTYILDINDGYIFVKTCNNTDWNIQYSSIKYIPEEIKERYGDSFEYNSGEIYFTDQLYEENDDVDETKLCFSDVKYFMLDYGFFAQKSKIYKTCNKCYTEIFVIDNQEFCLNCDKDILERSFKIKKILKNIK